MIEFDRSFFEGETRNDFFVEPMMKSVWAAQLEVLAKVDKICKDNNITYFADWGTLLGAVRHKGFIPWDDDLDICMLRPDYIRFMEIMRDNPEEIMYFGPYNSTNWHSIVSRVVNFTGFRIERDILKKYHGCPYEIGIDIFPIDYVPRDKALEEEQKSVIRLIAYALSLQSQIEMNETKRAEYAKVLRRIETLCQIKFSEEYPSHQELLILMDEVQGLYGEADADYVTAMHRLVNGQAYYVRKAEYETTILCPFENTEIPIPVGYDTILKLKYGDYMEMINKGGSHDYPFYKKILQELSERNGHGTIEETADYVENVCRKYYIAYRERTNIPSLSFPPTYFEENPELQKIRAAELEVYEEIRRICEKYSILYWAVDETLQGALKKKGFLPYEERFTIGMNKEDYLHFLAIIQKELGAWFDYRSEYTHEGYDDQSICILSDSYLCNEQDYLERFHDCEYAVAVRIVPLEFDSDGKSHGLEREKLIDIDYLPFENTVIPVPKEVVKKKYLQGEIRDGFYIEPMMKSAWAAHLEVLKKVDKICKENEIPYFADWGTLLGAVRHKGYIPWDDDLDIAMLRPDLERFLKIMYTQETGLLCMNMYTDPHWGMHATKILNTTQYTVNREHLKENYGFPFPAGVDIFPIDYVPRDKRVEEKQLDAIHLVREMACLVQRMEDYDHNSVEWLQGEKEITGYDTMLRQLCGISLNGKIPTYQELTILIDQLEGRYRSEDADYVTAMHRLANGQAYYVPKSSYQRAILMPFEDIMIPVPEGYDGILRLKYGDNYMTPINQTAGHDYPFYGALIRALEGRNRNEQDLKKHIERMSVEYYNRFCDKTCEPRIRYHESFFKNEEIDGIEVLEERKRIWAAQAEVLEEIKRICDSLGVRVFAVSNTLEDAVKHHNYGPKSEDLHLGMKRDDYVKFLNALQEELDPWFDYRTIYAKEGHDDLRTYIVTDGYLCDMKDYLVRFHECPHIVGVDISVIDRVDPDAQIDEVRTTMIQGLIASAQNVNTMPPYTEQELALVREWKQVAQIDIRTEGNLRQAFLKAADQLCGAFHGEYEYVRVSSDLQEGKDTKSRKEWYDNIIYMPFAETTIPVPIGYREILNCRGEV